MVLQRFQMFVLTTTGTVSHGPAVAIAPQTGLPQKTVRKLVEHVTLTN